MFTMLERSACNLTIIIHWAVVYTQTIPVCMHGLKTAKVFGPISASSFTDYAKFLLNLAVLYGSKGRHLSQLEAPRMKGPDFASVETESPRLGC